MNFDRSWVRDFLGWFTLSGFPFRICFRNHSSTKVMAISNEGRGRGLGVSWRGEDERHIYFMAHTNVTVSFA